MSKGAGKKTKDTYTIRLLLSYRLWIICIGCYLGEILAVTSLKLASMHDESATAFVFVFIQTISQDYCETTKVDNFPLLVTTEEQAKVTNSNSVSGGQLGSCVSSTITSKSC